MQLIGRKEAWESSIFLHSESHDFIRACLSSFVIILNVKIKLLYIDCPREGECLNKNMRMLIRRFMNMAD